MTLSSSRRNPHYSSTLIYPRFPHWLGNTGCLSTSPRPFASPASNSPSPASNPTQPSPTWGHDSLTTDPGKPKSITASYRDERPTLESLRCCDQGYPCTSACSSTRPSSAPPLLTSAGSGPQLSHSPKNLTGPTATSPAAYSAAGFNTPLDSGDPYRTKSSTAGCALNRSVSTSNTNVFHGSDTSAG